jgi:hypothetical protein
MIFRNTQLKHLAEIDLHHSLNPYIALELLFTGNQNSDNIKLFGAHPNYAYKETI